MRFVNQRLAIWLTALLFVAGPGYAQPLPPRPSLEQFAAQTQVASHFVEGKQGPLLYIYFDPNCIYCHLIYQRLRPYVRGGQVRVAWIPVGFLKSDSPGKAEAIIAAPDPLAAMRLNEQGFDASSEEGGVAPLAHPRRSTVRKIYNNTRLLAATRSLATPTLVFTDGDGVVHVVAGMPAHLGPLIAALGAFR